MAIIRSELPRTNFIRQPSGSTYRGVKAAGQPRTRRRPSADEIEAEIVYLREQNRLLRDAALFFGELSERLNAQLREERARARQVEVPGQDAGGCGHIS